MKTIKRVFTDPLKSYFLFGPRGTGKSTLMRELYPEAVLIDLLDPETYRSYHAYPERLIDLVKAHSRTKVFIIDEVQKVPDLLSVVHKLIEEKEGWKFVLTGSSARKLKRSGVDLLAGRAQLKHLHPFMASEMQASFNLDQALTLGMLPLVLDSPDPLGDLRTYVALYMQEEVQTEGLVRRVDQFSRFLEIISFSQASVLNYSNIARECHVSNKTVENYIEILEDLLLSFRIEIFTKKAKRGMSTHPKFYYFDAGVYRSIRPMGPLDRPEEVGGHTLETLVAQHLRAWLDYSTKPGQLSFWRTRTGHEVDFVIYGEIGFYAIEVKNTAQIRPQDLRGLQEFHQDYPECKLIFLYRGKERMMKNNILCIPVDEFLRKLVPNIDLV